MSACGEKGEELHWGATKSKRKKTTRFARRQNEKKTYQPNKK